MQTKALQKIEVEKSAVSAAGKTTGNPLQQMAIPEEGSLQIKQNPFRLMTNGEGESLQQNPLQKKSDNNNPFQLLKTGSDAPVQLVNSINGRKKREYKPTTTRKTPSPKEKRKKQIAEKREIEKDLLLDSIRGSYKIGQHGAKKKEQKRLTDKYGTSVTGTGFESEHTVGFEPLNQTSGEKRGKTTRARKLENMAPAYQEEKPLHRAHIGTGTHSAADASGFNSEGYRGTQRSLIEAGDVSSAVQINQLGYAFMPEFRMDANNPTTANKISNDSFNQMAGNMETFTYAEGGDNREVAVDPYDRAEMILAREFARTGVWSQERVAEVKEQIKAGKFGEV